MDPGLIKLAFMLVGLVMLIFGPLLGVAAIRNGSVGFGVIALCTSVPVGGALMWNAFG